MTAFDFAIRSLTSMKATLANEQMQAYHGVDREEELKRYLGE